MGKSDVLARQIAKKQGFNVEIRGGGERGEPVPEDVFLQKADFNITVAKFLSNINGRLFGTGFSCTGIYDADGNFYNGGGTYLQSIRDTYGK